MLLLGLTRVEGRRGETSAALVVCEVLFAPACSDLLGDVLVGEEEGLREYLEEEGVTSFADFSVEERGGVAEEREGAALSVERVERAGEPRSWGERVSARVMLVVWCVRIEFRKPFSRMAFNCTICRRG
jgi:hypothetical protein